MNTKLDLKSILIGLIVGGALFAAFGAAMQPLPHGAQVGRFQISSSGTTGVGFIIDTATGQAWSSTVQSGEFYPPKLK